MSVVPRESRESVGVVSCTDRCLLMAQKTIQSEAEALG